MKVKIGGTYKKEIRHSEQLKGEWDMHSADKLLMSLGDINGHMGRCIDGFHGVHGVHGGHAVGERNIEEKILFEFCLEKELCVSNTLSKKEKKRKVTFRMRENDSVLIKKKSVVFMKCEGNPWIVSTCTIGAKYK